VILHSGSCPRKAGCCVRQAASRLFAERTNLLHVANKLDISKRHGKSAIFRPDPRETAFSIVGYVFVGGLVVSLGVSAPEVSQQIADFAVTAVQPRPSSVEGQWNQNGRHRRFN
jgi:hypothetical protein